MMMTADLRRAFELLGEVEAELDAQIEPQRDGHHAYHDHDPTRPYTLTLTEGDLQRFSEAMALLDRASGHRWDRDELSPGFTVRDEMIAKNRGR